MQRLTLSFLSLAALAGLAGAQPAPDPAPGAAPEPPAAEPGPAQPATNPPPPVTTTAPVSPPDAKSDAKPEPPPSVQTKWSTTFYGFAQGDLIYDSIQGPTEAVGNGALPRPAIGMTAATYASGHDQFTTTARNSRLGFRFTAPTVNDIKPTGNIEFDFAGNQPTPLSEASTFVNATMRIRHAYLKFETPVVDVLIGQYWQLFGWQPVSQPGSIQAQGLPGMLSSRTPQLRIGKVIKAGDVSVDVEVAATRPGHRAGGLPDGVAGLKLTYDKLKAARIVGAAGSALDSAAVAVSVIGRRFEVTEFKATPVNDVKKNGYGLALNAMIPVVPATKDSKANALTLEGEFIRGGAIADLYTGLNGGVVQANLPLAMGQTTPVAVTPNIDNGLMQYLADGSLHPVHWQSFGVGLQYFLPPSGKAAIVANYSHLTSDNAHAFGAATRVFDKQDFVDGNLIIDLTPAVRLGVDFMWLRQTYVDGLEAPDYRSQLSGFFIF
jgi:hypothetical protein